MNSSFNVLPYPHPRPRPRLAESLQAKNAIKKIEEDMEVLQRELQLRVDSLQRQKDNHLSYISPFRCLPTEIFGQIIHICLEISVKWNTLAQICGTIRDIVVGTPTIWSTVELCKPRQGLIEKHCIPCSTVEQLNLCLKRARPSPLDLHIDLQDINPDLLRILSSQNYSIHFLTLRGGTSGLSLEGLDSLRLDGLKCLSMHHLPYSAMEKVLGLAMKSSHGKMALTLESSSSRLPRLLEHNLLQRVASLHLSSEHRIHTDTSNISIPSLQSLKITKKASNVSLFDLKNVEILEIQAGNGRILTLEGLGNRLTNLTLRSMDLKPAIMPGQSPLSLPGLHKLTLEVLGIEGPLHQYFNMPILRHLFLYCTDFYPLGSGSTDHFLPLSDGLFSQKYVRLENIELYSVEIDGNFVAKDRKSVV